MNEFHFLRPEWLWGFVVFLLLPFLITGSRSSGGLWRGVIDRFLLSRQLVSSTTKRTLFPVFLLSLCWIGAVIALAGPAWERLPQPVLKKGNDTVFVLDISLFMNVSDLKPSRMDRARFKMHDLLKDMNGGQYALVLYDNEPFVAVPLTFDVNMIENILPSISAGLMGGEMPRLDLALNKSLDLLTQAKSSQGNVIVLGAYVDSAYLSQTVRAAAALKKAGHKVSVLGVGTKQGAPIQLKDGSFYKARDGKPLLSGLTESAFEKVAEAGGGIYRTITLSESDIDALLQAVPAEVPDFGREQEGGQKADAWKDFGVYISLFILPFAALGFRKGWLGVLLFLMSSSPVYAWEWADLWVRPDRQEAEKIQKGGVAERIDAFDDNPAWKGIAEYRAGKYKEAAQTLNNPSDAQMLYNQGNALAHAGMYKQAIEAYQKALAIDEKHEDAAFNKKYLEEKLKDQQNQDQQNQDQQNQDQQNQDQQNQDQQNQDQQNQDQQNQDQQNQDQQNQDQQNQDQQNQDQQNQDQQNQDQTQAAQSAEADEEKGEERKGMVRQGSAMQDEKEKEKQEQLEWLSVIDDDPSGLLRERIRRHNLQKRRMR